MTSADPGIVVAVDGSPAATAAVGWAAREAGLRNVALTLVHAAAPNIAAGPDTPVSPGLARWQQDRGRRLLDEAVQAVEQDQHAHPAALRSELVASGAVPALVELSKTAQLVVAGCRGSGRFPGRVIGSVSSGLLRHAHCPTAIVHDDDGLVPHAGQAPVWVGIDGSPASEAATAIAFDAAARRNVELVALHAWSDSDVSEWPGVDWPATQPMAEQVLAERLAGWQERYPDLVVRRVVVRDQPARQLVERSQEAQLLVVGNRGRGGYAGMLVGSVSETVAQLAHTPVIVARA